MTYIYDMPELSQVEFEQMRNFVEVAYRHSIRSGIRPAPMELVKATQTLNDTPFHGKRAHAEGRYNGFAWSTVGQMWVKPGRPAFDMKRTTLHELSHLRVTGESHGPKFRRVFGVALTLFMKSLGHSESEIHRELSNLVYRYRKYRAMTPQGRYNSRRDYQDRCYAEIREIAESAKAIYSRWF